MNRKSHLEVWVFYIKKVEAFIKVANISQNQITLFDCTGDLFIDKKRANFLTGQGLSEALFKEVQKEIAKIKQPTRAEIHPKLAYAETHWPEKVRAARTLKSKGKSRLNKLRKKAMV